MLRYYQVVERQEGKGECQEKGVVAGRSWWPCGEEAPSGGIQISDSSRWTSEVVTEHWAVSLIRDAEMPLCPV